MKLHALLTSYEPADYLDLRLADYKEVMTDDERRRAMVPVWLVKIIEPGADEAYTCRITAEDAPKDTDLEGLLFEPVEVDCRGLAAKGFIRSGQTGGAVEADTITFQAVSLKPLGRDAIKAFNRERQQQAVQVAARKAAQRDRIEALKKEIDARLQRDKVAAPVKGSK